MNFCKCFNKPRTLLAVKELNVCKSSPRGAFGENICRSKGNYSDKCLHISKSTALPNLTIVQRRWAVADQCRVGTSFHNSHLKEICSLKQERFYSTSGISSTELKKQIQDLTDQFMEAKELMQDARESMGTVYFSEDMEEAQQAVKDTLEQYHTMLNGLSEEQRQEVLRTIGLKMEELKAQEQALEEELKDDH